MNRFILKTSLILLTLHLSGCLQGEGPNNYVYTPNVYHSPPWFKKGEPEWNELCALKWPGELFQKASEYCTSRVLSPGVEFDKGIYLAYSKVENIDQLESALKSDEKFKYVEVATEINGISRV